LLALGAGRTPEGASAGCWQLGGEHDWKDDSEPVESAFAWVRDADADTTIEKGDRLVPSTGPAARRPRCVPPGCRSGTASATAWGFVLAQMERTFVVARLAQRGVLVPTSPTLPRPDGVAVNQPAGGVPIRLRPRTLSNVEPVSPT
jgi:hypothetical protein